MKDVEEITIDEPTLEGGIEGFLVYSSDVRIMDNEPNIRRPLESVLESISDSFDVLFDFIDVEDEECSYDKVASRHRKGENEDIVEGIHD